MGDQKKPCLCKAKNCSGLIGEKPLDSNTLRLAAANGSGGGVSSAAGRGRKPKPKVKKVQKVQKLQKEWEDLCFRCFDDGELLMCDYKTCPKVYHLSCLGG